MYRWTMLPIALVVSLIAGVALAGDPAWSSAMDQIKVQCAQPGVSQDPIPFVGYRDECDNSSKVIYTPVETAAHHDMVIDPRNSDAFEWDTARYKRYGTYWPTANVTWFVPSGFKNFWTRIYYAIDLDKTIEPMKYQFSKDGKEWLPVPNVHYDVNVFCVTEDCNWYKRKEEEATWDEDMFYFKAIWPAPCPGEVGHTYAADQRVCLSLPPPGWQGTEEEFDVSPLKDLYYTPQMSEIILGATDLTPDRPTNLKMTPGKDSVYLSWDPPSNPKEPIIGYIVYYMVESTKFANDPNYQPPYLPKHVNVGHVSGVVLTGLDPALTVIARVAAVSQRGSGPSTLNVWSLPAPNGNVPECPATLAPVVTIAPDKLTPTGGPNATPKSSLDTTSAALMLSSIVSISIASAAVFALI